jgi:hypothetical protein
MSLTSRSASGTRWNAKLSTSCDRYPPVWSVADLGRELETNDPDAVLRPLVNAGLVHRIAGGFVFASASAFKMVALVGHVV